MARKTIGLFFSGDDDKQEGLIENAILRTARELDYNVISLHSIMKKPSYLEGDLPDSLAEGEGSIFFLTDYSKFDGIIVLGEVVRKDVMDRILAEAKKCNVPLINVNNNDKSCYRVNYDDVVGMKKIVLHLIREHGCRNICCISGFEGNKESEDRILAYREALEEENIPFRKDNVLYGMFYRQAATQVEEYLKSHPMPDAFACANDSMAMFVITYLMEQGYRVPEDVIVTGFDHLDDGTTFEPSISTVGRALEESGEVAVKLLQRMMQGEEIPQETCIDARLFPGQSCGCEVVSPEMMLSLNQSKLKQLTQRDIFLHHLSVIWRKVSAAEDMYQLLDAVLSYVYFFGFEQMDLYLSADLFGQTINMKEKLVGYNSDMVRVHYENDDTQSLQFEDVHNPGILPEFDLQGEHPVSVEIIPLFFSGRSIGFLTVPVENCIVDQPILYTYLVTLNSAINNFCLIWEKDSLVNRLDSMYVRDALTKLYNRFGMERFVTQMIHAAQRDNKQIMCVALDLDGLKKINDQFGHAAGDNAILQVANAMRQASESREICVRSGGDEYLVFGIMDNPLDVNQYIQRVQDYLKEYNDRNQWPYQVSCSCGYSVKESSQVHSAEDLLKEADEMMYRAKEKKKGNRTAGCVRVPK